MRRRDLLIAVGIIVGVVLLVWFLPKITEGFQAQSSTAVFRAKLQDLTSMSNLRGIATSAFTPYNSAYDINEIKDSAGAVVWKLGDPQSTDTDVKHYLTTLKTSFEVDPFIKKLSSNTRNLEYIGTTMPADITTVIVVLGKPSEITSSANLRTFASSPTGTYSALYDVSQIEDSTGKMVWAKGAGPLTGDVRGYFKVKFMNEFSLAKFTQAANRRLAGVKVIGKDFPADLTAPAESGAASQQALPPNFFNQPAGVQTNAPQPPPEYVDPRSQPTAAPAAPTYTPTAAPNSTDRVKIEAKYKIITNPLIIQSIEKGLGNKSDGAPIKITEIRSQTDTVLWPKPDPGYNDTDQTDLFTITYDSKINPMAELKGYIDTYIPSVKFKVPALPSDYKTSDATASPMFSNLFESFQNGNFIGNTAAMIQGLQYRGSGLATSSNTNHPKSS